MRSFGVTDQMELIQAKEWDVLCILDACRYDYFERTYGNYLQGDLRKVRSPASSTAPWMRATFAKGFDDIVYVSGHPAVNSKAVRYEFGSFFHHVVDVWKTGWNDDFGTTMPEHVTRGIFDVEERFPDRRIIAHYVQPHGPYLSIATPGKKQPPDVQGEQLFRIYKESGKGALEEAYLSNLRRVLREIIPLSFLEKKIVLTSDHGELLGEDGKLGHPVGFDHPILREVPWFEIA